MDQIQEDLRPENLAKVQASMTVFDPDLPGGGQLPCIPCSRHFADENSLQKHLVSKLHKKRLKLLKEKPYTLEEARAAGGEGSNAFYSSLSPATMTS